MNPVIVLGMHRSGTSAMARLVQELGMNVGANLLPATDGNVYGHFEDEAFIRFHDELIKRQYPKRAPFCEWLPLAPAEIAYTQGDRVEAESIWETHRMSGGTAWKDPRTSLFLDLWMETLPDARAIVCLRHPYQVHRSLLRRGEPFLHVDYGAAIAGWTIYNQRILEALAKLPKERYIVLDVETAFRESRQLTEGLAKFLDIALAPKAYEAIAPEAFHFEDDSAATFDDFESYLPAAGAAYRQLRALDYLHPISTPPPAAVNASSLRSEEARLLEFEEAHDLRAKAKKMLIRSIAVDRQRTADFYKQVARASAEKDGLIEDLGKLTDALKARLAILEGKA